jgi:hypothetical protein
MVVRLTWNSIIIIANQSVLPNAEKDGKFTRG